MTSTEPLGNHAKVGLITGGARGLGLAHATRFMAAGYRVVVADLDEPAAQAAAKSLGGYAVGWHLDVRDPESVARMFEHVDAEFGRLDCLVNNAGTAGPEPTVRVTEKSWAGIIDVHLGGTFRCSKYAHPLLARSHGSIVNISSLAALIGHGGRASYASAKGGIISLTRDLAIEWIHDGIRVNAVAPGPFLTDMTRTMIESGALAADKLVAGVPMGRLGDERELADVVFFLAETATFMTGQTLVVDGGMSVAPHVM